MHLSCRYIAGLVATVPATDGGQSSGRERPGAARAAISTGARRRPRPGGRQPGQCSIRQQRSCHHAGQHRQPGSCAFCRNCTSDSNSLFELCPAGGYSLSQQYVVILGMRELQYAPVSYVLHACTALTCVPPVASLMANSVLMHVD